MRVEQILAALARLRPRSRATLELKVAGDHALMKALQEGGLPAVHRLVAALNAGGHRFALVEKRPGVRGWREEIHDAKRAFELRVATNRSYKSAALRYLPVQKVRKTKAHALQELFYARYMAIGQKAYRDSGYRLSPAERRLLLVGELEADVNNGGFSQYLHNKGVRRARAALVALNAIGARKTAAMLALALAPEVTEAQLAALDERFYRVPEDLAVLGARHAGLA
jgi:hypothetical protein